MPAIIDIADAIKAEIEAATLSQTPTVQRVYIPVYDRAKVSDLRIYVVPRTQGIGDGSRSDDLFTMTFALAIYKPVDATSVDEVDEMVSFTSEVLDLFRNNTRLTNYEDAVLTGIAHDAFYDAGQLDSHQTFVSLVTLTYTLLQ